VGCWCGYLSGAWCRLPYGPADATATHCLLLHKNPDGVTFLVPVCPGSPRKRALNRCMCVLNVESPSLPMINHPCQSGSISEMVKIDALLLHTSNRKYHMASRFVPLPFPVTLNDPVEGHSPAARLFKCNSTNICATFRTVLIDSASRGFSVTAELLNLKVLYKCPVYFTLRYFDCVQVWQGQRLARVVKHVI